MYQLRAHYRAWCQAYSALIRDAASKPIRGASYVLGQRILSINLSHGPPASTILSIGPDGSSRSSTSLQDSGIGVTLQKRTNLVISGISSAI